VFAGAQRGGARTCHLALRHGSITPRKPGLRSLTRPVSRCFASHVRDMLATLLQERWQLGNRLLACVLENAAGRSSAVLFHSVKRSRFAKLADSVIPPRVPGFQWTITLTCRCSIGGICQMIAFPCLRHRWIAWTPRQFTEERLRSARVRGKP
jgi:hypothetical protein